MDIFWLKERDLESLATLGQKEGWLVDSSELSAIFSRFPHLCYGAYDKGRLIGAITGYLHEKSAWIGNFIIDKEYRGNGQGKRLFSTLLNAIKHYTNKIYLNAAPQAQTFYERFGFRPLEKIGRYMRAPKEVRFNLNSEQLKDFESVVFENIAAKIDLESFEEDRSTFLFEDMVHKSSLRLTQPNGFLHAKMICEGVCFISGFEVRSGAYLDAEKLMRGLLHYKALKKIYADIPYEYAEIRDLYEKYDFTRISETMQMGYDASHTLRYENIYAFASTGVSG